jgi:ribonuclease T1
LRFFPQCATIHGLGITGKPEFCANNAFAGDIKVLRWFKNNWVSACLHLSSCLVALALLAAMPALAKGTMPESAAGQVMVLADLPKQGRETYALILAGGPFPYEKDGSVFGNRERLLPVHKRGFYREYTVKTPYARTRGAKRIVCGGSQPVKPEVCYYTDDHYASFKRIAL